MVMDELFGAFKMATRRSTQLVYAKKIKANSRAVRLKKLQISQRRARNEEIPASELDKVNVVTTLNLGDLGGILYGKLDDDGYGNPNSSMATAFTKEKIDKAMAKVRENSICLYVVTEYE